MNMIHDIHFIMNFKLLNEMNDDDFLSCFYIEHVEHIFLHEHDETYLFSFRTSKSLSKCKANKENEPVSPKTSIKV